LESKSSVFLCPFLKDIDSISYAKEEKNSVSADAISALVSLGYSLSDATRAVHCVAKTKEMKVEDVIKMALRNLIG